MNKIAPCTISQLQQFVQQMRKPKVRKVIQKKPRFTPFMTRKKAWFIRQYPQEMKEAIIRTVYSNGLSQKRPRGMLTKAAMIFNMPISSVKHFVEQFESRGRNLTKLNLNGRSKFKMIPALLQKELVSVSLLQEWCRFSMKQRISLLAKHYNVQVSIATLKRFYTAQGVSFKATKRVYRSTLVDHARIDLKRA